MEAVITLIGIIFIIPVLILYSSFSWGYVATVFWSWFVMPLFPSIQTFTWMEFAGLMFMVSCFVHGSKTSIKKEYKDESNEWITIVIAPWMTLLGGWIFHLFY